MSYNSTLKAALQAAITTPANPKISGTILQQQLLAMVNAMEAGAVFMGAATPATSPTGEANCFYLATTQGTYTNFVDASGNAITLSAGEVAFLSTVYQGNNLRYVKNSMPQPDSPLSMDYINVKDYGAKGDGSTDDTSNLESAMAAAYTDKKPLYFPAGTYIIRRSLTLKSGMTIKGDKDCTIKKKAASTTTLSSQLNEGATTMQVVSSSGFEVGDQITISSTDSDYPNARYCSVGYITEINGNSITFESAYNSIKTGAIKNHVAGCYVTNSFAIFRSWGMLYDANDVSIEGITLDGNRQNGEFGDWMNGCVHIDATTGTVNGIPYTFSAKNLTLKDLTIKNSPFDCVSDQGDGGLYMENCKLSNPYMHGVHFGTNYDGAKCIGNEVSGTVNGAAFFWCQNVQNISVTNNIVRNCNKGCSDYEYGTPAQNSIITCNVFKNITNYVFDFSHSTQATFKDRIVITSNLIEDVNYAIANFTDKTQVVFSNNIISNFVTTPAYLFNLTNADYVTFIGNMAKDTDDIFSTMPVHVRTMGNSWDSFNSYEYPYTVPSSEIGSYSDNGYYSDEYWNLNNSGSDGAKWRYVDLRPFVGKYVSLDLQNTTYRVLFLKNISTYLNYSGSGAVAIASADRSTTYPNRIVSAGPSPLKWKIEPDMKFINFAIQVGETSVGTYSVIISES